MSQAGELNVTQNHPEIPTTFDANTGSATPLANIINILGAAVAAGGTPVTTTASGNTLTVDVQRTTTSASSSATNAGLASFNSADFTVDANGFVTFAGTGSTETLTGNTGGAISPAAGNINTVGTGSITIAGAGNTLTTQLTGLTAHNVLVGEGTATVGLIAPSTAGFVLTSNGAAADPTFQAASASGAITTITGNSGGAESPSAGNFNIVGTGSIIVAGTAATETIQLTGLTAHNVLVGEGTATVGLIAPSTAGFVLTSNGAAADPTFQAASAVLSITSVLHSGSPYTVLSTDEFLACQTSGGVITIKLPNSTTTGRLIYVKDSNGAAATSNISVTTVGGTVTIDGQTTYTMNINYQSLSLIFDGTNYEIF